MCKLPTESPARTRRTTIVAGLLSTLLVHLTYCVPTDELLCLDGVWLAAGSKVDFNYLLALIAGEDAFGLKHYFFNEPGRR